MDLVDFDPCINFVNCNTFEKTLLMLVGVISWLTVIYLDIVKSRIQADDPVNPKYNGMIDTIRKCYKEGGIRIFGRGNIPLLMGAFPLHGVTFFG